MGAHFESTTFDGALAPGELRRKYDAYINDLLHQHGADAYNGTLTTTNGLQIEDKTLFDSQEAAERHVADNTNKWDSALAVKYRDVRTEPSKQPTYNGKTSDWPLVVGAHTLRTVAKMWNTTTKETGLYAADQLAAAHKAKAIALWNDWDQKETAFKRLRNTISALCQRLQDVSAPAPTAADFKELQRVIKQRARAHAAEKKAAEKLRTFDIKQSTKIYATKQVDHGVQWFVGGWAAE